MRKNGGTTLANRIKPHILEGIPCACRGEMTMSSHSTAYGHTATFVLTFVCARRSDLVPKLLIERLNEE
jgi:hypothetical protein